MEIEHIKKDLNISKHGTPEAFPQYGVYVQGERNDFCTVTGENAKENAQFFANSPQIKRQRNDLLDSLRDCVAAMTAMPGTNYFKGTKDLATAEALIIQCRRDL